MNRQQNRERERVENKLRSWVKSWTTEQKKLFEKMVTNEVNKIEELTEQILNEAFGVAIKEEFEELEVEQINKILLRANDFLEDYKKIIEESKGDYIDMLKTLEPVIKKEIKAMIKEGKDKLEGIKELRAKHKVPQNELVKMWLEIKEGIGIVNPHTPKKTIKKSEEIPQQATGKIENVSIHNEGEHGFEIPYTVTEKGIEAAQEEENKPQLELVDTIQKIKGKFGIYSKGVTGVKLGDKLYKDKLIVEEDKNAMEGRYNNTINSMESEIERLKLKLKIIKEEGKKELEKYEEIEAVFSL